MELEDFHLGGNKMSQTKSNVGLCDCECHSEDSDKSTECSECECEECIECGERVHKRFLKGHEIECINNNLPPATD